MGAAAVVYLNQIGFVYALEKTSASVVGLILGATPIFAALAGLALGTETLHARFWTGAVLSFGGVALVALGSGGEVSGDLGGVLLGVLTAATWAGYSILVTPLMTRYSATRISALVLGARLGARSRSPASRSSPTRTGSSAGRCGRCSSSRRWGRSC